MEVPQTHALAAHLSTLLCAQPIVRLDLPAGRWQANVLLLNCTGQVIQQIRAHGKWLFCDLSHGYTWAIHLLAKSTWRVVRAGPRKDGGGASGRPLRLVREGRQPLVAMTLRNGTRATLTGHPLFLILPTEGLGKHPDLAALGPDPLVATGFSEDFAYRMRNAAGRSLGSALLDQTVVAGLGNPLKCEALFRSRLHPATRVSSLLASQVDALGNSIQFLTARFRAQYSLFYASRGGDGHPTREALPYAVYDRAGEPCAACGTAIEVSSSSGKAVEGVGVGMDSHLTWYCPACQKLPAETTLWAEK